jgi:hypothetical protein
MLLSNNSLMIANNKALFFRYSNKYNCHFFCIVSLLYSGIIINHEEDTRDYYIKIRHFWMGI